MKALPILFFFAIALCAVSCADAPLPDMAEVVDEQGTRSDTDAASGITITVDTAMGGTIDYPF